MGLTANLPRHLVPRELVRNGFAKTRHDSPATLRFIGILLARPFGDREAVYSAIYGSRHEDEQPAIKILDIYASSARKVLKSIGVEMETIWGRGWRIDPANKAKLRAIIDQINSEQAAA